MDYKQQFGNTFSMGLDYMPKRENINNKSYNFFGKSEDIKPNIIHNNGNCGRYGPIVSRNNFFSDISGNICHNIQCQQRSRKYEMEINRLNEEVKKLKIEYKHFENENAKLKQTIEWLHLNKSSIIPTCDIDLQHNLYNNNGINGYNLFNNNDNNNNDRIIPMQTYNPIYNPNETHFNDTNGGITMPMLSPNSPNDTRMIIKTNNNIIIHNHNNNGDNSDLTSPMAITPKNHKNSILNNSNNINPFLSNNNNISNNNNNNRQSFPKLKRQNTVNNLNIKHSAMDEMSIHTSNTDNQTMTTNVSNTKITNNNNNNNRLRNNLHNNNRNNNNGNNIENIISPELPNLNSFSRSSNLPLYNPFPPNMSTNIPPNIPGNISTNISRSWLSNGSDPNTIRSIPSSFRSSNESLSFNNIHHPFLPVNEPSF